MHDNASFEVQNPDDYSEFFEGRDAYSLTNVEDPLTTRRKFLENTTFSQILFHI